MARGLTATHTLRSQGNLTVYISQFWLGRRPVNGRYNTPRLESFFHRHIDIEVEKWFVGLSNGFKKRPTNVIDVFNLP